MTTTKQRMAFQKAVRNGGNVSKAMVEVGYSPNTAHTPSKLTNSLGFQELCNEYGLTDDLLVKSLVEDIKNKGGNRKAELELGFKVKGRMMEEKPESVRPIVINMPLQVNQRFEIDGTHTEAERSDTQQEQI